MQELYIIRHGLAGKPLEDKAADEKRRLKKKGRKELEEVVKCLRAMGLSFDHILTSPLARSKETAEIVNDQCGGAKTLTITPLLKPGSSYGKLLTFLQEFKKSEKVALVGHEPFLSGFASYCLTKSRSSFIHLKKGAILKMEVDKVIRPGQCTLGWLIEPSQIIS